MFATAALVMLLGAAAPTLPAPAMQVVDDAAATCRRVWLTAEVNVALGRIEGHMACEVLRPGELWLAIYPELIARADSTDELTALWVYPDGFSPAHMRVRPLGGPQNTAPLGPQTAAAGLWQSLGTVRAGTCVRWAFSTQLPVRQGPFGLQGPVATLLGGWHPVLGTGPIPRPRITAAPISYSVRVPDSTAGFVGKKPFGRRSSRVRRGLHQGTMVPALVAPQLHVRRDGQAVLVAAGGHGRALVGHDDISAALDGPAHAQVLTTVNLGQAFVRQVRAAAAAQAGQPAPRDADTHTSTLVVIAPLREHLAEAFEGGVAVSDRAFHLLPLEMLRRFHRASIWREQMRAALLPALRTTEHAWPPEIAADATAAALTRALLEATGSMAYAPQLLEKFALSPEIEALIYAPQIPFPDVYFSSVHEGLRPSHRLDAMLAPWPRGKILFEKLRDTVGTQAATQVLIDGLVPGSLPLKTRLVHAFGKPMANALCLWLGPYPEVDYLLAGDVSDKTHTQVHVGMAGRDANWLIEPIEVRVTDSLGKKHSAHRMGPGPVDFDVPGPIKAVQVDPDSRLVELAHPPRRQARFNNSRPHRYRALLNDLSATLDVTGQALAASADVLLRRVDDLRYDAHLGAFVGPFSFGAQVTAASHFGRELTPLRLAHALSASVGVARLRADAIENSRAGRQLTLGLAYRYDTRLSRITALSGTGIDAGATLGLTRLHEQAHVTPWAQLGLSWLHLWPMGRHQALVLRLRGDTIIGAAPVQAQLRLGGRYLGARGFQIDEGRGPHRLLTSGEYRHVLVGDSRTDVLGLMTLTRVEGAFFGDAIYMPQRGSACDHPLMFDVGYGVRLMGDVLGVSPAALAIDVGLPIGRCVTDDPRLPVTLYVAFVQSFFAF